MLSDCQWLLHILQSEQLLQQAPLPFFLFLIMERMIPKTARMSKRATTIVPILSVRYAAITSLPAIDTVLFYSAEEQSGNN